MENNINNESEAKNAIPHSVEDLTTELGIKNCEIAELVCDIQQLTRLVDENISDKLYDLLTSNPDNADLRTNLCKQLDKIAYNLSNNYNDDNLPF